MDKLQKLIEGGQENLHIIADFDGTLTKGFVDGVFQSSYALVRNNGYLDEEYCKQASDWVGQYRPIEVSTTISNEEKAQIMDEWWSKHWDLLVKKQFSQNIVDDILLKKRIQLREGARDFFELLSKYNIPLVILSAGLGNTVQAFLEHETLLTSNVHLVLNLFVLENGVAVDYTRPLVTSQNKNESRLHLSSVGRRRNVILLGDSVGDANMSDGMEHNVVLKIGFLNDNDAARERAFREHYHIVIKNDGPMDEVMKVLEAIVGASSK